LLYAAVAASEHHVDYCFYISFVFAQVNLVCPSQTSGFMFSLVTDLFAAEIGSPQLDLLFTVKPQLDTMLLSFFCFLVPMVMPLLDIPIVTF